MIDQREWCAELHRSSQKCFRKITCRKVLQCKNNQMGSYVGTTKGRSTASELWSSSEMVRIWNPLTIVMKCNKANSSAKDFLTCQHLYPVPCCCACVGKICTCSSLECCVWQKGHGRASATTALALWWLLQIIIRSKTNIHEDCNCQPKHQWFCVTGKLTECSWCYFLQRFQTYRHPIHASESKYMHMY